MALCTVSPLQDRICPVHEGRGPRPPPRPPAMLPQAEEVVLCDSDWLREPAHPIAQTWRLRLRSPTSLTCPGSGWCWVVSEAWQLCVDERNEIRSLGDPEYVLYPGPGFHL